jgi:polysaccharide pyruvyl transferase WcaK-like protein
VGGDIFNNAREWAVTKAFLLNLVQLRRHPGRTILFGQSIPRSCHGLSFLALRQCLLALPAVCVRDAQSHGRLRQAGVDAWLSFDTAFALQCSDADRQEAAALYRAQQLRPEAVAVLSVRAFDAMYRHDTKAFIERLAALCARLMEAGLTPAVLIQSRAYGADNDLAVADALQQRVPALAILDPFRSESGLPCWSLAMGVLALAGHVIAVRYHTAVLALAAGVVPHHLHYSNKGRDLCERLELPGEDLGRFDPDRTVAAVLARERLDFDHQALRQRVRADFRRCLQRVGLPAREGA